MIKKTITFTDYDGNERTEDYWFNISKAELVELENSVKGGLKKILEKAVQEKDGPKIMSIFKEIILKAYGVKSNDGRRFMKDPEITRDFIETEAYVNLFMELATDEKAGGAFMDGVLPKFEETTGNVTSIAAARNH